MSLTELFGQIVAFKQPGIRAAAVSYLVFKMDDVRHLKEFITEIT